MNAMYDLTIILPFYNEQKSLEKKLPAFIEFAIAHPYYHFRFVNDGSTDQSLDLLERSVLHLPNVSIVSLRARGGKGHAVRAGFDANKSDYFCFLDGDIPYSLDHLHRLLEALKKNDMVIGCRNLVPHVTRSTRRRQILGWMFNRLARMILNLPHTDTQAGIKGFHKKVAQYVFPRQRLAGFSFDVELLYLARKGGFSIAEIPATVADDHSYKIGKIKLLADSLQMFADLISIRWNDLCGKYEEP
ncbi:MAG: glycosyltransferase [Verrucomicrobiota bacterium]